MSSWILIGMVQAEECEVLVMDPSVIIHSTVINITHTMLFDLLHPLLF